MAYDPTRLAAVAQDVLIAASEALAVTPGRVYVAHGPPAWDLCTDDQLAVYVQPVTIRSSGRAGCQVQRLPVVHVQLVRCVPGPDNNGTPPAAADLTASAVGLLDDLGRIIGAVTAQARDLFGACDTVRYGEASPLGPSGNAAAWDWPITPTI